MDYPYENLSPEKFQLFCQALLVKEHPNIQCFPVGQPDGGRDATQFWLGAGNEAAMFQVKFVRRPNMEADAHKKIVEAVQGELPKIKKQLRHGVKRYVLMTNVPGTAHPDVGTIDTLNELLSKELGIPAVCWWRNDLNRRMDNAWDLKWSYPELMTGPDLIRAIVEGGLSESRERRGDALRAFVAHQYGVDEEVKFKQVDLQNRLLDLFIDVPLTMRYSGVYYQFRDPSMETELFGYFESDPTDEEFSDSQMIYARPGRERRQGAASFFLNSSRRTPFIVLEGAPGQGKSTIAQYICQVHRMRLLNKATELNQLLEDHRTAATRLPIKVDLRDLASWINRRNPFSAEGEEIKDPDWAKSLEAFLAALIKQQSGGAAFDVADLHAVFRLSAVLLVLDGLDEVADVKRRTEVVAEITKGVERLKPIAAALQVVVTSRPTAFANTPGLPEKVFQYYGLDSVTSELIDEYANKWLRARKLQERESSEVKKILREKLGQPHMRDLARNPMQLAILLSLIHTQGTSLPDKRTALYDSYVRLFFNREAEKSDIVRDNRDLLIDIHRFLAWLLHTEAEQTGAHAHVRSNGAIEEKRLKQLLSDYLKSEGHSDPDLPERLFSGVVERVVALVSRVQGTYEFEVQPLREYFAARFLYETAPYSPPGNEKRGTKPDRFDAIARDFYWFNVARFYAGCYSKGELASLIDRLNELTKDQDFRLLSHPRVLAATLLGDWVFSQHPKSVSEVIRLILDGIGIRFLLTSNSRRLSHSQPLSLPPSCGRSELVTKCFALLRDGPPDDFALDVLDLLRANSGRDELIVPWRTEVESVQQGKRTAWLSYGTQLGCVSNTPQSELLTLISDIDINADRVEVLFKARRAEILESSTEYFRFTLTCLLDRVVTVVPNWRQQRLIDAFGQALDATRYALAFRDSDQEPLNSKWKRRGGRGISELQQSFDIIPNFSEAEPCIQIIRLASEVAGREAKIWATELSPWDELVTGITRLFGERWVAVHLANIGSGIRSSSETCTDFSDLFDSGKPLSRRARYARLRAGAPNWWRETFLAAKSVEQKMLGLVIWFTWASPNVVSQLAEIADSLLSSLDNHSWQVLFDSVENAVELTMSQPGERQMDFKGGKLPQTLSARSLALLRLRAKRLAGDGVFRKGFSEYKGTDNRILKICQNDAIERLINFPADWDNALEILSRSYKNGVISARYSSIEFARRGPMQGIPVETAAKIAEKADQYPSFIVAAAEARCRESIAKKVRPVAKLADEDKWFIEQP